MEKKRLFHILNNTNREDVIRLSDKLLENHDVSLLKKPEKMLVMLEVRESARNTFFYAGEALCCECMVSLDGVRGFAAGLGDDTKKTYAMAVIDAALNAKTAETKDVFSILNVWEQSIREKRDLDAKLTMSTKVNFSVMEE